MTRLLVRTIRYPWSSHRGPRPAFDQFSALLACATMPLCCLVNDIVGAALVDNLRHKQVHCCPRHE
eukprot:4839044-Pleurochrysis_carterae.AAC.5